MRSIVNFRAEYHFIEPTDQRPWSINYFGIFREFIFDVSQPFIGIRANNITNSLAGYFGTATGI